MLCEDYTVNTFGDKLLWLCDTNNRQKLGFFFFLLGNLHLNITAPEYNKQIANLIEPFVYEFTAKHSGSISAEHGLGFVKNKYIYLSKKPEAVGLMHRMKQLVDPNNILNPYKTLPKH